MAKKAPKQPRSPLTDAQRSDRELARAAQAKQDAGERPSQAEMAAQRRVEKAWQEEYRWKLYRAIPAKDWRQLSGLTARQIIDQSETFSLPFRGATVDLTVLVPAIHRLLKENRSAIATNEPIEPKTASSERLQRAQAELKELEIEERRKLLVSTSHVHEVFGLVAGVLRMAADALRAEFGDRASGILAEAIEQGHQVLEQRLPPPDDRAEP